jgi:hypothetical protein
MIVVPAELTVNAAFWEMSTGLSEDEPAPGGPHQIPHSVRYIEFLSSTFENIDLLLGGGLRIQIGDNEWAPYTIIIPDGTMQNAINRILAQDSTTSLDRYNLIEKSQFRGIDRE